MKAAELLDLLQPGSIVVCELLSGGSLGGEVVRVTESLNCVVLRNREGALRAVSLEGISTIKVR